MKLLYITNVVMKDYEGVSKKIINQCNSLNKYFSELDILYKEENKDIILQKFYFSKKILTKKKNNIFTKILFKFSYEKLYNFILENDYTVLYIRYDCRANPFFNCFLKKIKEQNIKILMEIPTYPYDNENNNSSNIFKNLLSSFNRKIERKYRYCLSKYVHKIITFSDDNEIFNIKTIKISNGINLKKIKLIDKKDEDSEINFIIVSSIAIWHGIDRFILSMASYYKKKPAEIIKFHIVGDGEENIMNSLRKLVQKNKLEKYVIFYGFQSGKKLEDIYNRANIAVGSLGRHRSGISTLKALKNREYAAKGLPMIFSENDLDFEDVKFVYKVSPDENLINLEKIIQWYKELQLTPQEIRKFSEKFSWDIQMKKVIDNL